MEGEITASEHVLAARLRAARARQFVGRTTEIAFFQAVLQGKHAPLAVLWLHGPGGIGKSTLLDQFGAHARAAGRTVFAVDCRAVDPDPEAFTEAVAGAAGAPGVVLLVDTFEQCSDLEDWFRGEFLPRLAEDCLVVVASRALPASAWRTDTAWQQMLRVLPLRNLERNDAVRLLDLRGISADLHEKVLSFAGGHPLALALAATVAQDDRSSATSWEPGADVLRTLLSGMVGALPSAAHRRALEICAHSYDTTEELLRAVLGDDADELFGWLREQPFIESGPDGLFPHDVVRDVLDADLRWRDPAGYETMHRGIRRFLLDQARQTQRPVRLNVMGALAFLHRHGGVMPDFVTSRRGSGIEEDDFRPADRDAVLRMATAAEGAESARIAEFWLDRQPEAFHLQRRADTGEPVAFMAWLRLTTPTEEETAADPVVALAWEHSRATGPIRPGEHIALARFMVDPGSYQRPSSVADLIQLRILFEWLRATRLAWSYLVVSDPKYWEPQLDYLDQHRVGTDAVVGGRSYWLFGHDWRAIPVEQWMDRHVEQELFGPRPRPVAQTPELVVLSRDEFDQAVREALRRWHRDDLLAANPLTRSRVVVARGGSDPADVRRVLAEGLDTLARDPKTEALHRAVSSTYVRGAPTQEAAAERLGLPLSTYRRHLSRGIATVCDVLWGQEIHGTTAEAAMTPLSADASARGDGQAPTR